MREKLSDFVKNIKQYFNYIMKMGFGDLFVQFLELIILILISLFVYIPVEMVHDVLLNMLSIFGNLSVVLLVILNFIFSLASALLAAYVFIHLFNKRYEDLEKRVKEESSSKKDNDNKTKTIDMEMPKMKENK